MGELLDVVIGNLRTGRVSHVKYKIAYNDPTKITLDVDPGCFPEFPEIESLTYSDLNTVHIDPGCDHRLYMPILDEDLWEAFLPEELVTVELAIDYMYAEIRRITEHKIKSAQDKILHARGILKRSIKHQLAGMTLSANPIGVND